MFSDIKTAEKKEEVRSLDYDLQRDTVIVEKVKDNEYAAKLYGSLTNALWVFKETDTRWTGSFRAVGGLVADLRPFGEDYLEFYMSSDEGVIDSEIEKDLNRIGWYYQKRDDLPQEEK